MERREGLEGGRVTPPGGTEDEVRDITFRSVTTKTGKTQFRYNYRASDVAAILGEYDHAITLRQLYYVMVSRGIIPNADSPYKKLSEKMVGWRESGDLDWTDLEDRTRTADDSKDYGEWEWKTKADELYNEELELKEGAARRLAAAPYFSLPRWYGQSRVVELWMEKDAITTELADLAENHAVTLSAMKGFSSYTQKMKAVERIKEKMRLQGTDKVTILYFGDFDPSGVMMYKGLIEFLKSHGIDADLRLLGVTRRQVDTMGLPENPAKETDTRLVTWEREWKDELGEPKQVEIEALDPTLIRQLADDALTSLWDPAVEEKARSEADVVRAEWRRRWEAGDKEKALLPDATDESPGSHGL